MRSLNETLAHVALVERVVDLGVQSPYHGCGRLGGCKKRDPRSILEIRKADFGERRHLGKHGDALVARRRQHAQQALLDVRESGRHRRGGRTAARWGDGKVRARSDDDDDDYNRDSDLS